MLKKYMKPSLWVIVVLLLCVFYLFRLPPQFESRGILITDEVSLIIMCALMFFVFREQDNYWKYIGLILTITLFMVPLLRLWQTAESSWNIVLGLFPFLDATGYYLDAQRLIQGGLFSDFSGRRPLFASLLSVLLSLSGQNLQVTLIIFALLNGIVVFLFSLEIQKQLGPFPGVAVIYIAHFLCRPFIGTLLTEQLGIPLGMVSLMLLIHSVRMQKKWEYATGLLLLTFALLARAGSFFILPMVFGYGIYLYGKNRRDYLPLGIIFAASIIIPFFLNSQLGRFVAVPNSVQFGNFSDTLYGQAVGGKGWRQIILDHPEVANLQEPQRSQGIYRLAYLEIIHNPANLLLGAVQSWRGFISPDFSFGYLNFGNETISKFSRLILVCLFWIGMWLIWSRRSNPNAGLIFIILVGIFFSIPFIPPGDAGIRPYTVTIGAIFLPIAYALSRFINTRHNIISAYDDKWALTASIFSLVLVCSIIFGAILIKFIAPVKIIPPTTCLPGLVQINIRITHGSYILFVNDTPDHKTHVPFVLIKDIQKSFAAFPDADFAHTFRRNKKPSLITLVADVSTNYAAWLIGPPELASAEGREVSICGEPVLGLYPVLITKTFQIH